MSEFNPAAPPTARRHLLQAEAAARAQKWDEAHVYTQLAWTRFVILGDEEPPPWAGPTDPPPPPAASSAYVPPLAEEPFLREGSDAA